jgi:UDP-GlcNAc:undecaprenyl-phosphate GlcNAc-1-phosphate transferase
MGLYFFNSPPALLFLGDAGAQALGFALAVLAVGYNPQGAYQSSSWLVPIMLLSVPMFDTALVIVSRLRRNRPVYTAARDHTYHRLLRLGLSSNRAVLVMQIAALVAGCLAFVILNQPPLIANTSFILLLSLACLALILLDNNKLQS